MTDFLDIIHRPVFIENNVRETGFYLRRQIKVYYSVGPSQ
jgi:hypothetical protein